MSVGKNPLAVLVSTRTPLKTADQAARLVWLTDNWPRVALSLRAVVKRSSRRQSFVGWAKKASLAQALKPTRLNESWPALVTTWPLPLHACQFLNQLG